MQRHSPLLSRLCTLLFTCFWILNFLLLSNSSAVNNKYVVASSAHDIEYLQMQYPLNRFSFKFPHSGSHHSCVFQAPQTVAYHLLRLRLSFPPVVSSAYCIVLHSSLLADFSRSLVLQCFGV